MTDGPEVHDFSRLDAHMASVRRTAWLHAAWRPTLAGAVASLAVSAAIWVVLPKVTYTSIEIPRARYVETEIPRLTPHDYELPHITTKNVQIPVPKIVEAQPFARTPDEERFVSSADWANADVRGRILRADKNGFDLTTEDGRETSFFPARIRPDGKVETNEGMRDIVEPFLNDLAVCRPMPTGVYLCIAEHEGREIPIKQIPIKRGRPT